METETYSFLRREFLNQTPEELDHTSYILATVENSFEGEYHPTGMLYIADCRKTIRLEFYLGSRLETRTASMAKINLLLEVLGEFRSAIVAEADKITKLDDEDTDADE